MLHSTREVVLTTYISAHLAQQIKKISKFAVIAVKKDNLYSMDGRWGSKNRVKYMHGNYDKNDQAFNSIG
jgi:hypothetical protein